MMPQPLPWTRDSAARFLVTIALLFAHPVPIVHAQAGYCATVHSATEVSQIGDGTTRVVEVSSVLSFRSGCLCGVIGSGRRPTPCPSTPLNILDLLHGLEPASPRAWPNGLIVRHDRAPESVVYLESSIRGAWDEGTVHLEGNGLVVARQAPTLSFALWDRPGAPPLFAPGRMLRVLSRTDPYVPSQSVSFLYVGPVPAHDTTTFIRLEELHHGRAGTPLQRWWHSGQTPFLRPTWSGDSGDLRLLPVGLPSGVVEEMRMAVSAADERIGGTRPVEGMVLRIRGRDPLYPLAFEAGAASAALPGQLVEVLAVQVAPEVLRAPPIHRNLSLDARGWSNVLGSIDVCLSERYAPTADLLCRPLLPLLVDWNEERGVDVCVDDARVQVQGAAGGLLERAQGSESHCAPVRTQAPLEVDVAVVGSTLRVPSTRGLCLVEPSGQASLLRRRASRLDEPGVYELRAVEEGAATCSGTASLTLYRLLVLDPQRDWVPVGIRPTTDVGEAWERVPRDTPTTFRFERGRDELSSTLRLAASVTTASLIAPPVSRVVSQDIPHWAGAVAREEPSVSGVPPSLLATVITGSEMCPAASVDESGGRPRQRNAQELQQQSRRLVAAYDVDSLFYWHLLARSRASDNGGVKCLAVARFRVHGRRSTPAVGFSEYVWLEGGYLVGLRAMLAVDPEGPRGGLLLYLPLGGLTLGLADWAALQASMGPSIGVDLVSAGMDWLGATLSFELLLGIPPIAARLFGFGFSVHVVGDTQNGRSSCGDHVCGTISISIDIASIFEGTGGR